MRAMLGGWVLLGGCFGTFGDGTQTGTEVPDHCEESGRSVVAADATSDALGFAPQSLFDALEGAVPVQFTPPYDSATTATFGLDVDADSVEVVSSTMVMRFVDDSVSDGQPDAPTECAPRLEAPGVVTFTTEDGAFTETIASALAAYTATEATLAGAIAVSDVAGTARPTFEVQDWPYQTLALDASFQDAWTGSLTWQGSTDEPTETFDTATGTGTVSPTGESILAGSFAPN